MGKKRLITRSDFDGLVCAMLFKELDMIDEIKFVHPKDVQDGKVYRAFAGKYTWKDSTGQKHDGTTNQDSVSITLPDASFILLPIMFTNISLSYDDNLCTNAFL